MIVGQRVRPGRYTLRDYDPRLPADYPLLASASAGDGAAGIEARLERFARLGRLPVSSGATPHLT